MALKVIIKKKLGDFTLDINFEHKHGVLGLLGASGCGKSITLRCIAGLITPDSGYIELDGRVLFDSAKKINLPPDQRRVGYLFQDYVLFNNLTVREQVELVLRAQGVPKDKRKEQCFQLLAQFYLTELSERYPHTLSGGQKQRVALVRMLASNPQIILLDEPFSALDSYMKVQVEPTMDQLFATYTGSTIYVTHDRDEVNRYCEQVCVLERGELLEKHSRQELFARPRYLATAKLSGCKNFSRISWLDENTIKALDWQCELKLKEHDLDTDKDCDWVGMRVHHLKLTNQPGINRFPFVMEKVIRQLFEYIVIGKLKSANNEGTHGEQEALNQNLRVAVNFADFAKLQTQNTYIEFDADALILLRAEDQNR